MVRVFAKGHEFLLNENILLTDLVYKCEMCGCYHLAPKIKISDIIPFEE